MKYCNEGYENILLKERLKNLGYCSPSQDSNHPDDRFQSRYVTPRFKPFS